MSEKADYAGAAKRMRARWERRLEIIASHDEAHAGALELAVAMGDDREGGRLMEQAIERGWHLPLDARHAER